MQQFWSHGITKTLTTSPVFFNQYHSSGKFCHFLVLESTHRFYNWFHKDRITKQCQFTFHWSSVKASKLRRFPHFIREGFTRLIPSVIPRSAFNTLQDLTQMSLSLPITALQTFCAPQQLHGSQSIAPTSVWSFSLKPAQ